VVSSKGWWWIAGGAGLVWLLSRQPATQHVIEAGEDVVTAAISGWKNVRDGPLWVPVINGAEAQYGIPPDLLARVAYQESHFRPEIIDGTVASSAGALGIMQMLPLYFSSVRVATPFSASDTAAQIQQAAAELARLYGVFLDWGLALAAYNDGQNNVSKYLAGTRPLPDGTITYVTDVLADVPVPSARFNA